MSNMSSRKLARRVYTAAGAVYDVSGAAPEIRFFPEKSKS
jgi:hypothetical protein